MFYSELIHKFLEGSLDKQQQDLLFMALSSNEEFRQELIDAIEIDKSFANRLSRMAPTSASTISVFSQLGFTPPTSITQTAKIPFFKKYFQGIIAGITTAALTSLFFVLFVVNPETTAFNEDKNILSADTRNNYPVMSSSEIAAPFTNDNHSGQSAILASTENQAGHNSGTNRTVRNNAPATTTPDVNIETPATKDTDNYLAAGINRTEINDSRAAFSEGLDIAVQDPDNEILPDYSKSKPLPGLFPELKGWGLELKGSWYSSDASGTGQNLADKFQNYGLNLTYSFNSDMKLVIGIADQKFDQVREDVDKFGSICTTRSEKDYLNFSAGLKYDIINFDEYSIFTQAGVGVLHNFNGGTASLQLGGEYSVSSDISIILNGELMILGYDTGTDFQYVPKFGVNCGIGFNF